MGSIDNTTTSTYAVLGSTGNCGSALVNILLRRPDARINAFCRSRSKLLNKVPSIEGSSQVEIFEGNIQDAALMAKCLVNCKAVFLCISTNDNVPGCRLSQDTAAAVLEALQQIKAAAPADSETPLSLPKVVLLSSGTVDPKFSKHVPRLLLPILLRSASYVYQDLIDTEQLLRAQESWLTSIFVKPGALSVDIERGYALSLEDQDGPTSYLDLAAGMLEAADDVEGKYDGKDVSLVCTNGPAAFPSGTPMCIATGLARHYFPFVHGWLPTDTGPK